MTRPRISTYARVAAFKLTAQIGDNVKTYWQLAKQANRQGSHLAVHTWYVSRYFAHLQLALSALLAGNPDAYDAQDARASHHALRL